MVNKMGAMTTSHSSRVCKKDGCCIPRVGQDMGFDRELFWRVANLFGKLLGIFGLRSSTRDLRARHGSPPQAISKVSAGGGDGLVHRHGGNVTRIKIDQSCVLARIKVVLVGRRMSSRAPSWGSAKEWAKKGCGTGARGNRDRTSRKELKEMLERKKVEEKETRVLRGVNQMRHQ